MQLNLSSIQVKLDDDNWIAISLNIPYTINVTDVNVIRFKTGSGVSYPITLTCDLISTVYILSASSSLDNGKFLWVDSNRSAYWDSNPSSEYETIQMQKVRVTNGR